MNIPKTFLTEAIDNASILKILTQNKSGTTSDPQYKALAQWAIDKHRQSKIKNIELNTLDISDKSLIGTKLSNRYNTLGSLLDALHNLMKQEGKYGENKELSNQIQKITLEILTSLKNGTKAEEPKVEEEPEELDLHEGMDWTAEKARRLTEARETGEAISSVLDKFYNDYYSVEYAGKTKSSDVDSGIVTKLKSLDKILIPEFNALGYSPDVNPFAQFLKILIEKKRGIFDKLTTNTYGAIHNSFIEKHITGNMLGNYSEQNILFCDDLYNHNGLDMISYLSLQKQALSNNSKYSEDKDLIAKMFIQQQISAKDYTEKVRKLFTEPVSIKIIAPGDSGAKLKSELEVQELYRHLFKSVAKKTVNAKTAEEILERAKKEDVVLSMIRYILDQNEFTNSRKYADFAQDTKKWLNDLEYSRNETKVTTSEKILADYLLDASAENLIVRHLREYADKVRAANNKEEADK